MKHLGIAIILAAALTLSGCGDNSNSNNNFINGNWTATLTGSEDFNMTLTLTLSGSAVSVTNLSFTTSQSCFDTGATASGIFTATGTVNGITSGSFQMTILSAASNSNGTNNLSLQGTLTNNSITGTWNLAGNGVGCTGSGTFTMAD